MALIALNRGYAVLSLFRLDTWVIHFYSRCEHQNVFTVSDICKKGMTALKRIMTSSAENPSVDCTIVSTLSEEQIVNIVELYRSQGWWLEGDDVRENLIAKMISGSHCFVIASVGDTIIGMGRAISDGISDAYIQDVAVRLDHRNRGIGRMILRNLVNRLLSDGIRWIGLIAEPGSVELYKHSGFHEISGSTPMLMIEQ